MRAPRQLREAKKAKQRTLRPAHSIVLTKDGIIVDGERIPYWVSTDVDVTTMTSTGMSIVRLGIFTKTFRVANLPPHAHVERTYE